MIDLTDYPVKPDEGVAPVIYRAIIIQPMAFEYLNYMKDAPEEFTLDEGFEAARNTWDTEWDCDPEPRTIADGIEAARQDLQYWNEE